MRSGTAFPRLAIAVVSFLGALCFWWPALHRLHFTGFGDWQMIHHNWEVGWVAITRFGEWPLWDPFHCGGVTVFGNPETQHFSPSFFLSFVVGTTIATKVMVILYAWAGIAGTYVFARREQQLGHPASLLAALGWGWSGFFAWQIGGGHATFTSFYLAPWLLLAWRRAAADVRWVAAVAGLMTLSVFEGGTYPVPYFIVLLAFDAAVRLVRRPHRAGVIGAAMLSGLLFTLCASVRVLPVWETLQRLPRQVQATDSMAFYEIAPMLMRAHFPWQHPDHPYVWNEYSSFVGVGITAAAVAGLVVAIRRRRFELVAGLLLFGALMMGHRDWYWPWALLHELPGYDSLRVPSRFSVLFTLYLVLVAGLAFDRLPGWVRAWQDRGGPRWLAPACSPWIALVIVLASPFYTNNRALNRWSGPPLDTSTRAERFHMIKAPDYHWLYASLPRRHQGTARCYRGNMNWEISDELWNGDEAQVRIYTSAGEAGEAHDWGRTVNTAWADVTVPAGARVVLNHNHDPGWKSSTGRIIEDHGRLAVEDLPAGRHRIELRYRPDELPLALGLSGGGFAAAALVVLGPTVARARRRRGRPRHGRV